MGRTQNFIHGLVSLLPPEHYQKTEELWQMLDDECGLSGIKSIPIPHFSWLIGTDFDWKTLEDALAEIARKAHSISVQTGGIGIFSGIRPVIYIPVVRNAELNALHRLVWEAIQPIGMGLSPFYSPRLWMPHISLAYQDVTHENIGCAMQKLAFHTFNWEFEVNNISFMHEADAETGELHYQYDFEGK